MNIRKKFKFHKRVLSEIADLVIEEDDDAFIVEIVCRKLVKLGYLKLEDGHYIRRKSNDNS